MRYLKKRRKEKYTTQVSAAAITCYVFGLNTKQKIMNVSFIIQMSIPQIIGHFLPSELTEALLYIKVWKQSRRHQLLWLQQNKCVYSVFFSGYLLPAVVSLLCVESLQSGFSINGIKGKGGLGRLGGGTKCTLIYMCIFHLFLTQTLILQLAAETN